MLSWAFVIQGLCLLFLNITINLDLLGLLTRISVFCELSITAVYMPCVCCMGLKNWKRCNTFQWYLKVTR